MDERGLPDAGAVMASGPVTSSESVTETSSTYFAWNDAIAAHFFRPASASRLVYLFVTEELIVELGRPLGGGVQEFLAVVRQGPPGLSRFSHCQRALQLATNWRMTDHSYPPYIAYLALFVLAGGHGGDFAPHAYYPRLWDLLDEQGTGRPSSFERMSELWDDLEQWSVRDRRGELGILQARIVGGWIHVGLPLAQTVLTEAERRTLPRIFAEAGLEPGTAPSNRELRRSLILQGRHEGLRPRTVSVLEQAAGGFSDAILDVVADDFLAWEGESTGACHDAPGARQVNAGLRLCLSLDRVAGRVSSRLRCHSRHVFPDHGLLLSLARSNGLVCNEFIAGWSTPLAAVATGEPYRLPDLAWTSGLTVIDAKAGWRLGLRPARIRAFVEGISEGLPGLIEVLDLPLGRPFYLAFPQSVLPALETWLELECQGWRPMEINEGLPAGWIFGAVSNAPTDTGVREAEPRLAFPDRLSVRLVGGLRLGAGNSYLSSSPPEITVDGASTADLLYCEGELLASGSKLAEPHALPDQLRVDARTTLEVRRGDVVLHRCSIYLLSGFSWRMRVPLVTVDRFGQLSPDESGASGAIVPWQPSDGMVQDLLRTPGLRDQADRVYFVGRVPGEIACWPRDPIPEWSPVWAIPFGKRRGRALFCGTSLSDSAPQPRRHNASARRSKSWVAMLGRRRHRITPPQNPGLKLLWGRYREVARALR